MKIGKKTFFVFLLSCLFVLTDCQKVEKIHQTQNRYLFLDSRIVKATENVSLELGEVMKDSGNPLFEEEYWADPPKKWEARFDNLYPNVIFDDEDRLFKIWYKSFVRDASSEAVPVKERPNHKYSTASAGRQRGILYAYSEDGIRWIKPVLGLVEFDGSSENNIILLNFEGGVFKDNQEHDPKKRYKMFGRIDRPERHMAVAFSEDGLNWAAPIRWPEHNVQGDAHNNAIWSSHLNKYVGITRVWADKVRIVARTDSEDFINWTEPQEVLRGKGAHDQMYSMPIFYHANVYLGLPSILNADDTVDTELAWSPDTKKWYRISPGQPIIPRGKGLEDYPKSDYDAGCIYASVPVITEDEILLFYGGSNHYHTDWRESSLNLARMRPDGFAGYEVVDESFAGIIETNLFVVTGSDFKVNADIKQGGFLKIAVLDESGGTIAGFAPGDSETITGNALDKNVTWNGSDLSVLEGKTVAFRFEFENAKVYSFAGNLVPVIDRARSVKK